MFAPAKELLLKHRRGAHRTRPDVGGALAENERATLHIQGSMSAQIHTHTQSHSDAALHI